MNIPLWGYSQNSQENIFQMILFPEKILVFWIYMSLWGHILKTNFPENILINCLHFTSKCFSFFFLDISNGYFHSLYFFKVNAILLLQGKVPLVVVLTFTIGHKSAI